MRADAAHRVHRYGPPDHLVVLAAVRVGPALRNADFLLERDVGKFGGDAPDRAGIDAALRCDGFRRVLVGEEVFGEQLERRYRLAAVRQRVLTDDQR